MVTGILKREGFGNVETAADCRECRERCKNGMPDLIILDIGLPDGDGFSLMNEIRTGSGVAGGVRCKCQPLFYIVR